MAPILPDFWRRPDIEDLISELKRQGIDDERVLAAMATVPREQFVEKTYKSSAHENRPLPIGCDQTISQPFIVAYMTSLLDVKPDHNVLEIGTGSGYQSAILSQLCRHVHTIERYKKLLDKAIERFATLGLENISTKWGDGAGGWQEKAPFDRIIVTAAAREIPEKLLRQLRPGGKLVIPVDDGKYQWLERIERLESRPADDKRRVAVRSERFLPVRFVPLRSGTEA